MLSEVESHSEVDGEEVYLEVAGGDAVLTRFHLVGLLVSPFEVEPHHADRYFGCRPVGDESCHSRSKADLEILHCLISTVILGARTSRILSFTISVSESHLVEETEHLTTSNGNIGAEEPGHFVFMFQVVEVVEGKGQIAQINVQVTQVEVVAVVSKTDTCSHVVAEEVADVGADAEVVAVSFDILDNKEVQIVLFMLRVGDGSSHHPRPFGDEYPCLYVTVYSFDGPFPRWAHALAVVTIASNISRIVFFFIYSSIRITSLIL